MIELTDEMEKAYFKAAVEQAGKLAKARRSVETEGACNRAGLAAVLALVERDQRPAARKGYETAVAVLRDVADRTGSPAAAWCADYLLADPDRLAPPPCPRDDEDPQGWQG